jgi:hypothetical protein
MPDNAYKGEVTVDLDGRTVTLRATWGAMAVLARVFGKEWSARVAEAVAYRDPSTLAVILEAMSDGQITVSELMEGQASLTVANKVAEAFRFGYHGMKEPEKVGENPTPPQPMQLSLLTRALSRLGLTRTNSGA